LGEGNLAEELNAQFQRDVRLVARRIERDPSIAEFRKSGPNIGGRAIYGRSTNRKRVSRRTWRNGLDHPKTIRRPAYHAPVIPHRSRSKRRFMNGRDSRFDRS
jgi:hypothetical protein